MAALYGRELAEDIQKRIDRIVEIQKDRDQRIADGLTDIDDCFVSMRTEDNQLSEYRMQLQILSTDGIGDFTEVVDQKGNVVELYWFTNKWGGRSVLANGVCASSVRALLKKTGWHEETRRYPVWTRFKSNGSGMYGAYTGHYEMVKWDTNMVTGEYVG